MHVEQPEVFYTQQWAAAVALAFAATVSPLLLLAYEADRLCGIATLATRSDTPDRAFFLAGSTADYCDILSEPSLRPRVLQALFAELRKLRIRDIELANIPSDSVTLTHLREIAESHGFYLHQRPAYDCSLVVFGNDQERGSLFRAVREKGKEKRALRGLVKLGLVRLDHLSGDQMYAALTDISRAQILRFLATQRISPLVRPERRILLRELAGRLSEAGWLDLSRLDVNGEAAAWNFGFRFSGSLFWYLPTFVIKYQEYSPGACLLRLLLEESCGDSSIQRMDLGLGDEHYKERFANASRPTAYVELSSSRLRHRRNVFRYWSARKIERSPRAASTIRNLRDSARDLRARIRTIGLDKAADHVLRRAFGFMRTRDEVLLFEAPQIRLQSNNDLDFGVLDWQQVADAAMENADDPETLQYLMRCAARLKGGMTRGFVLGAEGRARHFLWIDQFSGFYLSEIQYKLQSSDPAAAMIFDCWTPVAERGQGYYAIAIQLAAAHLQQEQKHPWIFSAASNQESLSGIAKAGFVYQFSLVRKSWVTRGKVTERRTGQS